MGLYYKRIYSKLILLQMINIVSDSSTEYFFPTVKLNTNFSPAQIKPSLFTKWRNKVVLFIINAVRSPPLNISLILAIFRSMIYVIFHICPLMAATKQLMNGMHGNCIWQYRGLHSHFACLAFSPRRIVAVCVPSPCQGYIVSMYQHTKKNPAKYISNSESENWG